MKQQILLLLWAMLLAGTTLLAQPAAFKVIVSSDKLSPGDTLEIEAAYTVGDRQLPPATLALTLMKDGDISKFWQMRWPLVKGKAIASVILPDSMPAGLYNLAFAIQPRFLKLFCEYIYPEKPSNLMAVFSHQGGINKFPVKATPNRRFVLEDLLVIGDVMLQFQQDNDYDAAPVLMKVDAWLDSAFIPAAYGVKQLAVNLKNQTVFKPQPLQKETFFNNDFSCFSSQFETIQQAAAVAGLPAKMQFDSLWVPAAFKQPANMEWDCLEDSVTNAAPSVYDLLQATMKGMQLGVWEDLDNVKLNRISRATADVIRLRSETLIYHEKKMYRLYFDGAYGDPSMLVFPPAAFGSIKVFEPPFYTESQSGQAFGVIAFFSRNYPFRQPYPYRNRFLIKGYTPDVFQLPVQ